MNKTKFIILPLLILTILVVKTFSWGLDDQIINFGRWSSLTSEYSPISTPAVIADENYKSIRATLSKILDNGLYVHDIGVIIPLGLRQSVGLTWLSLMESRSNNEDELDKGNIWLLTYAVKPISFFSIGFNINGFNQALYKTKSKKDIGADAGVIFELIKHSILGQHKIGFTIQNIFLPNFGWGEQLRQNFKTTLFSNIKEGKLETTIDYSYSDPFNINSSTLARFEPKPDKWLVNIRISTLLNSNIKIYGLVGFGESGFNNIGLAGELLIPTSVEGKNREFTLAYQQSYLTSKQTSNISTFFRAELGKHRLTAGTLLEKAKILFNENNNLNAFLTFAQVIAEYPNYRKNDVASYYMGLCQKNLGMYKSGLDRLEKQKLRYPHSQTLAKTNFEIMDINYKLRKYNKVVKLYDNLNFIALPDSIIYHAEYIAGESFFKIKKLENAKELLKRIPISHPDYIFATQSLATIYATLDNYDSLKLMLTQSLNITPQTISEEESLNRSRVLMGYYLYENSATQDSNLAKAVLTLRKVQNQSQFKDEALLILAWSAIKAKQLNDCNSAIIRLINSQNYVAQSEAYLLKAYINYMKNNYENALKNLEDAENACQNIKKLQSDILPNAKEKLKVITNDYNKISQKLEHLALSRRSPRIKRKLDILIEQQHAKYKELKKQLRITEEIKNQIYLSKIYNSTEDDILYLQAAISQIKMNTENKKETIREKIINKKVENLQKKLEKLK